MKSAEEFIRSVVYAGESSENYLDTRSHLQTFTWLSCCNQNIQNLDPEEAGWKSTDDKLKPLWFDVFTFTKMTFVINKKIFIIKDELF